MYTDVVKNRLKGLREEKNITQKDLAEIFNLTRATIASYETGKSMPSIDVVLKYADYFNCSTDYILGRTNYKELSYTNDEEIKILHDKDSEIKEAAMELLKQTLDKLEAKKSR